MVDHGPKANTCCIVYKNVYLKTTVPHKNKKAKTSIDIIIILN